MSQSAALAEARRLQGFMNEQGVACSIEIQKGVAGGWVGVHKRGVLSHHIATRPSQGLTPGLGLVKRGRTGLTGPLCNGYGGYDFVYRIITMEKANHAGTGGPLNLINHIPANTGNTYLWGTEYEGGYEPYTPQMREFMGRSNAALVRYFNSNEGAHGEHKTWTNRKVDRLGYTTQSGRDEIAYYLGRGGSIAPLPNSPQPVGTSPWAGKNPNAQVANGSRTLRLYSAGTDVRFVQVLLGIKNDGLYGGDTVAAVRKYQRARKLSDDGITGPQTWRAMLGGGNTSPPAGTSAPAYPLQPGWYFGPRSGPKNSVSGYYNRLPNGEAGHPGLLAWQEQMIARGWKKLGKADGLYGPKTAEVAEQFQVEKGLGRDGLVGRETFAAAWNAPVT